METWRWRRRSTIHHVYFYVFARFSAGPAVGGEPQHCLVCVARRIPTTEKLASANRLAVGPEQFTTKLDVNVKIVAVGTTLESLRLTVPI